MSQSAKRKLDEKHVKMLRELATQPANKQCFDCHQRGPTYVNMTIGSFVCTGCSGILRGLNPPHRVKSISMAAFTPDEIDFVKLRGNEYCKKVWLGLYDGDNRSFDGHRDEQQMKDFLILKYERKRWYVSPNEIAKQASILSANSHEPETKPNPPPAAPSLIDTQPPPPPPVSVPISINAAPVPAQQPAVPKSKALDLFDSDPFASMAPPPPQQPQIPASNTFGGGGNFANFAAFGASFTTPPVPVSKINAPPPGALDSSTAMLMPKSATVPGSLGQGPPVSIGLSAADKYSALAELDEFFSVSTSNGAGADVPWSSTTAPQQSAPQQHVPAAPPANSSSMFGGGDLFSIPKSNSAMSGFPQPPAAPSAAFGASSNPFFSGGPTPSGQWGQGQGQNPNPFFARTPVANPFGSMGPRPGGAPAAAAWPQQGFPQHNVWAQQQSQPNPFMGQQPMGVPVQQPQQQQMNWNPFL